MAIGSFKLPNTAAAAVDPLAWVRPADWLAMPTIGSQEFIGLLAITDDESNHIALSCQGAYTVDWGDGVTENVATNVKAQHSYTYSSISSGTLSTRGYKQVLVRVTPQAGQNLTRIDLQQQNSILGKIHVTGWLDISINGANITSLFLGGNTIYHGMCERVVLGTLGAITSFFNLFYRFYSLQSVSISSSSSVTNFTNMFFVCLSLKTVPLFTTTAGTAFSAMFESCYSLKSVPLFNLSNGTSFDTMFNNCYAMQFYPLFDTSKGTNFGGMFATNPSLQQLPNLNTSLGTNFTSMLTSCISLAKGAFQGTRYAISYSGFCLSQSAIVEIFNGLGTAVGAQTINVSSNPGRAALTAPEIAIATGKGWTVV